MKHKYYYGIRKNDLIYAKLAPFMERNKNMIIVGLIILTSMILSLSIITTKVTAERAATREKLVTSVKIEKGDSLWSIASQYITEEYTDMNSYIDEIMNSNGLTSDVIHEGNYIIVPYYTVKR
ncbi:MAG: LysM peptidoglycan-binding domain-containing protein [Anaerocolumna sp.]